MGGVEISEEEFKSLNLDEEISILIEKCKELCLNDDIKYLNMIRRTGDEILKTNEEKSRICYREMINFLQKKLESGIEEEATSYNLITLKLMKNLLSKLETTNDLELGSDCFKAFLNLLKRIHKRETYEYSDE